MFITNMIPLHALVLLLMGRFTSRLYVAYSSWYAIGTLASMQVPFVGFQPVKTSEHMAALGNNGSEMGNVVDLTIFQVSLAFSKSLHLLSWFALTFHRSNSKIFYLLQLCLQGCLDSSPLLDSLTRAGLHHGRVAFTLCGILVTLKSLYIPVLFARDVFLSDFDYRYIPIIASVSEHQPTAWPSFFMDLHFLIWLFPAGVVMCFRALRDEHIFVIIYSVMASYFAGVMVRLMLTLTPVVCVTSAVALSTLLDTYLDPVEPETEENTEVLAPVISAASSANVAVTPKKAKKAKGKDVTATSGSAPGDLVSGIASAAPESSTKVPKGIFGLDARLAVLVNTLGLLLFFVVHCTWVTANAYSSPSVVLASTGPDGSQHIIDDFREAYYWLRQNTAEDAVVMSWWDYGYQIAGMANRTTLVDNNTWNNSMLILYFISYCMALTIYSSHRYGRQSNVLI